MKRFNLITTASTLLFVLQPLLTHATIGDTIKTNLDEDTVANIEDKVEEVQDASVTVRQEALVKVLDQAEEILTQIETQLQNSTYASTETKTDSQALIDSAQAELDNLQQQAAAAETAEELTAVRQDALAWLQDNKDLAKEIAIDIYLDSLNAALTANEEIITAAQSLVPYYQLNDLDVTTYTALIATTEQSLATAKTAVADAENNRDQASLDAATRATAQATENAAAVVVEAEALAGQLD